MFIYVLGALHDLYNLKEKNIQKVVVWSKKKRKRKSTCVGTKGNLLKKVSTRSRKYKGLTKVQKLEYKKVLRSEFRQLISLAKMTRWVAKLKASLPNQPQVTVTLGELRVHLTNRWIQWACSRYKLAMWTLFLAKKGWSLEIYASFYVQSHVFTSWFQFLWFLNHFSRFLN